MSDLGTMISNIRGDLNRGTQHDPRIRKAIADAIRYYSGKKLPWNMRRLEALLTQGNEYYPLPQGWKQVDALRIEEDDNRDPLTARGPDWIDNRSRSRTYTGRPTDYAVEARELRFYPIPDRSYSLTMVLLYEFPEVSASASDGSTNPWMTEGEELIRKRAFGDLLVSYIGGDEVQRGLLFLNECEAKLLPELEAQAAREQSTGGIRGFL
jgi:hypothetical protein